MSFTARVRTPAHDLQRRPGAATREYRRTVRAAELGVWEVATPSAAQLRAHAAAAGQDSPTEERWFAVCMALALAGIVWGLADVLQLIERWPHFVGFVRHLIG